MKIIFIYLIISLLILPIEKYSQEQNHEIGIAPEDLHIHPESVNENQLNRTNSKTLLDDYRVNEQSGNSQKLNVKSAINSNGVSAVVWTDYRSGTSSIYMQLINSEGGLIGENFKLNSTDDLKFYSFPDIATNNENQFLVVWFDWRKGYAIYGQLIDEDGSFIGENFIVSDEQNFSYKTNPCIGSNGNEFIVAWTDGRLGSKYDIFAQRLDYNTNKIGENFIVNQDTQAVSKFYPDAAIDSNANVFVVWNSTEEGTRNVHGVARNSLNMVMTSQKMYNEVYSESSNTYYPKASTSKSGFITAWYRISSGKYDIMGQLTDKFGQKIDSNFVVNDDVNSSRYNPIITSNSNGDFRVIWYDYRNGFAQIYAQDYTNDNLDGENVKISDDNFKGAKTYVSGSMNDERVFISCWLDYGVTSEYAIYTRIIGSEMNVISEEIRIDDDEFSSMESDPTLEVFEDGSYIIAWTDRRNRGSNTYFQKYDNQGNPQGTNVKANENGSQYSPKVAELNDGNFLIVWREYVRGNFNQNEIVAQKYFKTGERIGDPFVVSESDFQGACSKPDISSNGSGEYVITWEKKLNGINNIYAQKFNSNSGKIGDQLLVSEDTTKYHYYPRVGIDSLGNFAITSYFYNQNNYDIMLKRYNYSAEILDSVLIVNTDGENRTQNYPDIDVSANGDCVITWRDYRSNAGIYFQKFENIGSLNNFKAVDSNIVVSDLISNSSFPKVSINDGGEIIISWFEQNEFYRDMKFRLFDKDLSPMTEIMDVAKSNVRDQFNQEVIFTDDKILHVWQDNSEFGRGYDIWANILSYNDLVTKITENNSEVPSQFILTQNYPNPFNPTTTINYSLQSKVKNEKLKVNLVAYDVLGKVVKTLVNSEQNPGNYTIKFNGDNISSGVYFYKLIVNSGQTGKNIFVETKKMILIK